ncbi:MAG: hypothetical protein ABGW69_02780 [Nanoarchaeota archaeon]
MVGDLLSKVVNSARPKKTRMVCVKLTEGEYNYILEKAKKLDESKSRILKEGYLALYLKEESRVYLGFLKEIKRLQSEIVKLKEELNKYKK